MTAKFIGPVEKLYNKGQHKDCDYYSELGFYIAVKFCCVCGETRSCLVASDQSGDDPDIAICAPCTDVAFGRGSPEVV